MDTDLIILKLMTARSKKLLVSADPDERDERGWTPLHAAVAFNNLDEVKKLIENDGHDKLLRASNNDGWTPLHVAAALNDNPVATSLGGDGNRGLEVLDRLLGSCADQNAKNKDGWTPLHAAAALNQNVCGLTRIMSKSAAPAPGVKDRRGRTPLHVAAAQNSNPEVVRELLSRGVDANARMEDYSTPLHKAARARNPEIVRALLDEGADRNARNKKGCTPLHIAAKKTKNPEIVKLLLDRCADPRLKNEKGELPVDLAERNKKLRGLQGTEVYWQLHDARYLSHRNWDGT